MNIKHLDHLHAQHWFRSTFQHTSLVLVLGIFSCWAVLDFWAEPLVTILEKISTIPVWVYQKIKNKKISGFGSSKN
jgi:hypothetical protein